MTWYSDVAYVSSRPTSHRACGFLEGTRRHDAFEADAFMVLLPVDLNPLKSSLLSQCEIARIKPARTGVQGDTRRATYAHLWSVFSYTVIYGVGSP